MYGMFKEKLKNIKQNKIINIFLQFNQFNKSNNQ